MISKWTFIVSFCLLTIINSCTEQENKSSAHSSTKNINQMNLTSGDTTGQLMDEDEFWSVIEKSGTAANGNYEEQIDALKNILLTFEATDIEKFDNTFTALLAASYDWKLWGAAYVINGGCSDDCFDYFRQYLIAHGKGKFYETLKDPESCAGWIKSEEEEDWEGLQYAAMDAYQQKTGNEIPNTYTAVFELKGEAFDEETVDQQYPKLAKKFMSNW